MRIRAILPFLALGALASIAPGQTFTLLHVFHGPDGADPESSSLILDSSGNLYSTTAFGGADGRGAVYKIDRKLNESVLYSFTNGNDGQVPWGLVAGPDGAYYGTASGGATGSGTVFRITPGGAFSTVYQFQGGSHAGSPSTLMYVRNSFYGNAGGVVPYNAGTIFKLSGDTETDLYKAVGGADGNFPSISVSDGLGNFYGSSSTGGDLTCNPPYGCGVIFKMSASGGYSILHVFEGLDGNYPHELTLDQAGNLYGTTVGGGAKNNGTVFRLSPNGTLTTLYAFTGGADGGGPQAGVVRDAAGNLYGTTASGGIVNSQCYNLGCGVVFMLSPSGTTWRETVLHSFNGNDGDNPLSPLLLDPREPALYGTTWRGGDYNCTTIAAGTSCGVVFKITR